MAIYISYRTVFAEEIPPNSYYPFLLKPVVAHRLSSALMFSLNFNVFGKYLNESGRENSQEYVLYLRVTRYFSENV